MQSLPCLTIYAHVPCCPSPRANTCLASAPSPPRLSHSRAGCQGIVIGLPVTAAGSLSRRSTDSEQGRRCRNFSHNVAALGHSLGMRVFLVNERYTTMQAEELLLGSGSRQSAAKQKKDSVAAALMLSLYYDSPGSAVSVKAPGHG